MNYSKLLLIILLLLSNQVFSNKIDDLKTDKDVNTFVKAINPDFVKDKYGNFEIKPIDSIAKYLSCNEVLKSWHIRNWEKVDITNDGLTDLVFIAYWYDYISYAIVDTGDGNFKLVRFSNNPFENCELIKPVKIGFKNYLKIFRKMQQPDTKRKRSLGYKEIDIIDTLIFKYNDFIELNRFENTRNEIESIEINTSYCFGSCPSFNLKLFKSGMASFEGIAYTKQRGKSSKRLAENDFKEIGDLINYINIKKLKNNYAVPWTDDQTATLTVIFKDHSKKRIQDYGLQGTFGLSAIYAKLMRIGTEWREE